MVIGNGMIATRFKEFEADNTTVIFASGVADSGNENTEAFEREKLLLTKAILSAEQRQLVYFSTCSIYDATLMESAYVKHKINMEALITQKAKSFTIFRLSNPVGFTTNNKTVLNFFIQNILTHQPFRVWKNASRNLIDIDEMYTICKYIISEKLFKNAVVNIANPKNYPVPDIIAAIEQHFITKGEYALIDKGYSPQINTSPIQPLFQQFNINFTDRYLTDLLQKYFPQ